MTDQRTDLIRVAQRQMKVWPDGVWGAQTHEAFLRYNPKDAETSTTPGDPPWVRELKAVYGWHEVRDNAKLRAWLKSDNKTLGDPAALPWCGDAVETAVKLALPNEPLEGALASNPYWARNWSTFGRAAMGCGSVGVFERPGGGGHVGFLVGHDATAYHVLGGNQGDSVNVTRIDKPRLIAARWPITWAHDPAPLPAKPASLPLSVNEV
jgi:uncharacterized protein (TIGR02594 family)